MKHQLVRFFTIFSLLTLLFGAVPAAPVGAEAHAAPLAASGDSLWAKSVGGTDYEYPASIATDSNGNVYVTGAFRETADFDPGAGSVELTSAGQEDIFLLKMDGNGNYAWAKRIGSTGIDSATSIAADASNNIYVTGVFSGTVDFDPGAGTANLTSAGLRDIFVAKYDSDGNYIWAKRMGGGTNDSGLGLTLDASGNVYTTGNYQGTADFDPGAGTANLTSAGNSDVFVSKLDSNGNFVWAKSMGGTEQDRGRGIAVSASGNVYTIGDFEGTADFDPGAGTANLTSAGADDVFISKLDSSGNFVWAKRIGSTDYEEGTAITMDAEENIYITGKYELTVDFDPGAGTFNLTSAGGGGDIFISKLDSGGNFVWAKSIGGTDFERGESIVLDANNNVYVTGVFSGTVDFDPGAGTFNLTGPSGDVFISILSQNGDFIAAKRMGGASYDWGTAITLDAQDNILVTGAFYETADFDPELTSAGDADVFIVKLEKVVTPTALKKTFRSTAAQDGWILESTETSNKGGTLNKGATTLQLGDDAARKQYLSILSFDTSSIPDNAVITKVTLKVKQQGITGGGNPVNMFQGFMVDIKRGSFGAPALVVSDFQTKANKTLGPIKKNPNGSGWYVLNLTPGKNVINKLATANGSTQIRLRFKLDDNNNNAANFLKLFSGNAPAANRPQLIVEYYVP